MYKSELKKEGLCHSGKTACSIRPQGSDLYFFIEFSDLRSVKEALKGEAVILSKKVILFTQLHYVEVNMCPIQMTYCDVMACMSPYGLFIRVPRRYEENNSYGPYSMSMLLSESLTLPEYIPYKSRDLGITHYEV